MSLSLKVRPHIRGHISSCNGRVDLVNVRVQQYQDDEEAVTYVASETEAQAQKERERKKIELTKFQKRVKQRAFEWERTKQLQLASRTTENSRSEQKIAKQAMELDKVQKSIQIGPDIEDIRTVATAIASAHSTYYQPGPVSVCQQARTKLLSRKGTNKTSASMNEPMVKGMSVQFAPTVQYMPIDDSNHTGVERPSHDHQTSSQRDSGRVEVKNHKKQSFHKTSSKRFSNPGQLEKDEKKQAALQHLLFRRLYSDLEREQARQNHHQQVHTQSANVLKRQKETSRRLVEEKFNTFLDSFSSASTEATEDQERVREWSELLILEERKQELQKSKENERYIRALQARHKEKLAAKYHLIPPLCSCATSVWDSNPYTCANNCPFYRNPKAYEKALSSLLQTLEP